MINVPRSSISSNISRDNTRETPQKSTRGSDAPSYYSQSSMSMGEFLEAVEEGKSSPSSSDVSR